MRNQSTGFIGLGQMGGGMALNLAKAGMQLFVHDLIPQATQSTVAAGASAMRDAAEVASSADLVFLCLPDALKVEEAIFGDNGLLQGGNTRLSIVDTSTLNHGKTLDIARRVGEAGISYSDCPVSGLPKRASSGTLTMMFGGEDSAFERAEPVLRIMGENILHCGPVGSGQMMKAINNIIYNINIVALCEVLPLAVKAGLHTEQLAELVLNGSSSSFASNHFVPRILERKFDDDFPMQSAYKDIQNVREIATRLQAHTPVVDAMTSTYEAALEAGLGAEPKSAMVKVYEKALGVEVMRLPGG